MQAEELGGLGDVAATIGQDALDVLPFHPCQSSAQWRAEVTQPGSVEFTVSYAARIWSTSTGLLR